MAVASRSQAREGGATTALDVPGAVNTRAYAINNRGEVVGQYDDANLVSHGFLLRHNVYTTLDFPGANGHYLAWH
jgi:probable HAF family extracellular repeat protein